MAPRPAVSLLPPEVLDELNRRLIDNAFGDYSGLAEWLNEQGFSISRSALYNHGSSLQQRMEKSLDKARQRMEIAKALRGATEEDKAALMEANEMVAMDQIMEMFEDVSSLEPGDKFTAVPKLVRAIADLNRSAIGSAKWKRDINERLQAAAISAEPIAKKAGLSDEDWAAIRAKFLGVEVA